MNVCEYTCKKTRRTIYNHIHTHIEQQPPTPTYHNSGSPQQRNILLEAPSVQAVHQRPGHHAEGLPREHAMIRPLHILRKLLRRLLPHGHAARFEDEAGEQLVSLQYGLGAAQAQALRHEAAGDEVPFAFAKQISAAEDEGVFRGGECVGVYAGWVDRPVDVVVVLLLQMGQLCRVGKDIFHILGSWQ